MPLMHCDLPLANVARSIAAANHQTLTFEPQPYALLLAAATHSNVRLMRPLLDASSTCFALCGKLSDVCAALDEMAAKEHLLTIRCAAH